MNSTVSGASLPGSGQNSKGEADETLEDWVQARGQELEEAYGLVSLGITPTTHCPTGLKRLDDAGLLELGVATIVLGHEGDGKSALGLQFLEGCSRAGFGALGFWPEDPRRFVADRVFSPVLGESASRIRRGRIDDPATVPARLRAAKTEVGPWAKRIGVTDKRMTSSEIISTMKRRWTTNHRLAVIDYAQVLSAEQDEKSVERVITRLVWDSNEFAKEHSAAVVILSQVRRERKLEGQMRFNEWLKRNWGKPPTADAVEGYRPMSGDGQWAPNSLGQKARSVLSWFRPNSWLREHGASIEDNVAEAMLLKNNYGIAKEVIRLRWHGPTTRISDPKDL